MLHLSIGQFANHFTRDVFIHRLLYFLLTHYRGQPEFCALIGGCFSHLLPGAE